MAATIPPSTCELLEKQRDGSTISILAHYVGPLKQAEQCEQTTEPSASAVDNPGGPGPKYVHDSDHDDSFEEVERYPSVSDHETLAAQAEDAEPGHRRRESGSSYFEAWFKSGYVQSFMCLFTIVAYVMLRAIVQDWTAHGLVQMPAMIACASAGTFSGHRTRVLSLFAMIVFADARTLPPYHPSQGMRESDTAVSLNTVGDPGPLNSESGSETHGAVWKLWVTVSLLLIGIAGGFAAWKFLNERARQIHAMFHVGAFTLVVAAAPVVLHQAGGIDAEINGPLWALWADFNVNFVLLGFMLVRKKQIGYPSPPIYIGILSVLWLFVFSATNKHNSRLYVTLTTFLVTIFLDLASWDSSSAVPAS
jgi:hypothetical protein